MNDILVILGIACAVGLMLIIWYALITIGSDDWNEPS